MEQIMTITMSHKDLEISETNNPKANYLIDEINKVSKSNSIAANNIIPIPKNLFTSEDLQISATPVKSTNPVVQQQYNELMNQIAIANSPRELQQVAEIPATDNVVNQTSDQRLQNAVKNLDLSWASSVGGSKTGDKTFAQLAAESKPKNLGLGI
jgi:hypothetical protein